MIIALILKIHGTVLLKTLLFDLMTHDDYSLKLSFLFSINWNKQCSQVNVTLEKFALAKSRKMRRRWCIKGDEQCGVSFSLRSPELYCIEASRNFSSTFCNVVIINIYPQNKAYEKKTIEKQILTLKLNNGVSSQGRKCFLFKLFTANRHRTFRKARTFLPFLTAAKLSKSECFECTLWINFAFCT